MVGSKRRYIEAAYKLLLADGLGGVSIRNVAHSAGCTSAALYKHFRDIDHLVRIASVRFLSDYARDARLLSQIDLNPLELNLQLWECLAFYSFHQAPIIENLFFGKGNCGVVQNTLREYYQEFPEEIDEMRGYMAMMFTGETIMERDMILLGRSASLGMIAYEGAEHLCKLGTYLFQGMLASIRCSYEQPGVARTATRSFMELLIRSYTSELNTEYTILVNKSTAPSPALGAYQRDINAYQCVKAGQSA